MNTRKKTVWMNEKVKLLLQVTHLLSPPSLHRIHKGFHTNEMQAQKHPEGSRSMLFDGRWGKTVLLIVKVAVYT